MSSKLRHIAVFSGTTILGDGTVIMIIDPNGIAQALGRVAPVAQADDDRARPTARMPRRGLDVRCLVFRAGSQQPKAVLLSLVARLEEIDCRRIEISDGRHLVQYRDQLMPLLRIDPRPALKQDGAQPILVFSDRGRCMGLVVDEIVDIVEQRLDIEVASERPGVLGYAVVKGSATEIIDIGHFLPQAFADWFRRRDARPARAARTGAAGRQFGLLPRHARAADQGRRLSGRRGRVGRAGARDASSPARGSTSSSPISRCRTWTGSSLPRRCAKIRRTAAIPVIALSAMVSAEAIERGRGVGFHDFVAKFDRSRSHRGDQGAERRSASGGVTA